jgi:ribulose-5-phosphate 4-epimerase/fuculose-1-phosphate aldolase
MTEQELRAAIVEVGRRLYARGYTASNDGNISLRLDDRRLLMTPKSVCKGFMSPDMMVITDLDGKKLAGDRDPSSEMQMHLEVYRQRPDAGAVVHAHPPMATGFAVAGIPLDRAVRDRRLRGVLQDGDDRALRPHQPGGAAARRRAAPLAAGGRSAAGAAWDVRHCRAGADLSSRGLGARGSGTLPDGFCPGNRRIQTRAGQPCRCRSRPGNSDNIP